jgi:hypothetical protein
MLFSINSNSTIENVCIIYSPTMISFPVPPTLFSIYKENTAVYRLHSSFYRCQSWNTGGKRIQYLYALTTFLLQIDGVPTILLLLDRIH